MADALASGASVRKGVGVQIPPRAPIVLSQDVGDPRTSGSGVSWCLGAVGGSVAAHGKGASSKSEWSGWSTKSTKAAGPQLLLSLGVQRCAVCPARPASPCERDPVAVSYTHLRAHETV